MQTRNKWKIFDFMVKAALMPRKYWTELLQAVLPPSLVKSIDWEAASMLSELLPDGDGMIERFIYADMIVRLPLLGSKPGDICSVIEIKSDDVRGYDEQLDRYSSKARDKHRKCGHIVRVLLYCGRKPLRLNELEELPEELYPAWSVLVDKETIIIDVHSLGLLAKVHGGLRAALMTLRDMRAIESEEEFWQFLDEIILPVMDEDEELFNLLLWFGLRMVEIDIDEKRIKQYIEDKEGGHEAMTIMENIAERNKRIGVEEERAEVAKRMLQMDLDSDVVHKATGLSTPEIEELRHSLNGSQR